VIYPSINSYYIIYSNVAKVLLIWYILFLG